MYYVILQVLLRIQGKELDTYQGINTLESAGGFGGRTDGDACRFVQGLWGPLSLKGNVFV